MNDKHTEVQVKPELFILMGRDVDSDFWSDAKAFKEFKLDTQIEIIEKAFKWFGVEDISKEWNKWTKGLKKDKIDKRKEAIRFLLFISQQSLTRKIPDEKIIEDLKALGISREAINGYMQVRRKHQGEFSRAMAEKVIKRYASAIQNVDWRVEQIVMTPYETELKDTILMLRVDYIDLTGKSRKEVFEFSEQGLAAFIDMLSHALDSVRKMNLC